MMKCASACNTVITAKKSSSSCMLYVLEAAEQGDKKGLFIKNQVSCSNVKKPTYSETVIRECVLCKACSNKGYAHVWSRGLFTLPCRSTLQKYVGKSAGEIGATLLIIERLRVEVEGLSVEREQFCSLIIDEMSIQQKVIYDRQIDKIFGLVDMGYKDGPQAFRILHHS